LNASTGRPRAGSEAELYRGSPRLDPLIPFLRALPRVASDTTLAALAIADGIRRGRYSKARRWAARLDAGTIGSHLLALRVLANHGRDCGAEAGLGADTEDAVRTSVSIQGRERLEGVEDGALLVGFHLGPPRTWLAMRRLGLRVRIAAQLDLVSSDPIWQPMFASGDAIPVPDDPAGQLRALYRMRSALAQNEIVYLTADGPHGREAFRLDIPGCALIVRQGWLALRRHVRVRTFPVLSHAEGDRRVIAICPPLPPVEDDAAADAKACRDVLTPLISDYVRRFPAQCRYLAFPPWQ
jgi:hypothetical protein